MVTKCTECGKRTVVLYPDLWVYKRGAGSPGGQRFFCSWHCLRAYDKGDETAMKQGRKVSEKSMKAVQIALEGGDPQKYLEECGAKNPSAAWYAIKQQVKENDPETYDRLPKNVRHKKKDISAAEAMQNCQDAADDFFGACADMGLNIGPAKICQPVVYEDMTVREVEGLFGRYRRSDVGGVTYIDFENSDMLDTLSFTVDQWKAFRDEQTKAAAILGVEL